MDMIKAQISGLQDSINALRVTERKFIKENTLAEQVEKARADKEKMETGLETIKSQKACIKEEKAVMLESVCDPLSKKIDEFLPKGCAEINMDEGLHIGWFEQDKNVTPYNGLSGGEKVMFDGAFANALLGDSKNKVIVIEAGELDAENLLLAVEATKTGINDAQIIINTCDELDDEDNPVISYVESNGWKVVRL